jgi:tRNA threonylcarbamoyladenosine biosynthesis protein TsaB
MPADPVQPTPLTSSIASMPCVLALDTTAGACSVAVVGEVIRAQRSLPMTQGHSRLLLGMVNEALAESGLTGEQIDAVAFGSGPGSFTGLRVACGVAQGLALGWGRPVVAVDSLLTLAWQAARAAFDSGESGPQDRVLVALDLRMQELAHAVYRLADFNLKPESELSHWPQPSHAPHLGSSQAALHVFEQLAEVPMWLAGDGFDAHGVLQAWASAGSSRSGLRAVRPASAIQPQAWAVGQLAQIGALCGQAVDAEEAGPFYLRDKVALDVQEQAAVRAARNAARAG